MRLKPSTNPEPVPASAASSATPTASGALPATWKDSDIGSVNTAGSAEYGTVGNNTYLVTGQGKGFGGSSDSLNYAYTQVTGDFTLTARLAGIAGADLNNTGLMMRETLDDNAASVAMVLGSTGSRIAQMGSRTSAGGNTAWVSGDQYTVTPVWFRLQRSGNTFTASQSSGGSTWFTVGTSTIPMASTYYVGLAASSGDVSTGSTETSTFDNVGVVTGDTAVTLKLASASLVYPGATNATVCIATVSRPYCANRLCGNL